MKDSGDSNPTIHTKWADLSLTEREALYQFVETGLIGGFVRPERDIAQMPEHAKAQEAFRELYVALVRRYEGPLAKWIEERTVGYLLSRLAVVLQMGLDERACVWDDLLAPKYDPKDCHDSVAWRSAALVFSAAASAGYRAGREPSSDLTAVLASLRSAPTLTQEQAEGLLAPPPGDGLTPVQRKTFQEILRQWSEELAPATGTGAPPAPQMAQQRAKLERLDKAWAAVRDVFPVVVDTARVYWRDWRELPPVEGPMPKTLIVGGPAVTYIRHVLRGLMETDRPAEVAAVLGQRLTAGQLSALGVLKAILDEILDEIPEPEAAPPPRLRDTHPVVVAHAIVRCNDHRTSGFEGGGVRVWMEKSEGFTHCMHRGEGRYRFLFAQPQDESVLVVYGSCDKAHPWTALTCQAKRHCVDVEIRSDSPFQGDLSLAVYRK